MAPSRGKHHASKNSHRPPRTSSPPIIPIRLQQQLLTTFATAFHTTLHEPTLPTTLQQVKTHLFARDFTQAFSQPAYLLAYAARWSPSRALAYLHLLSELVPPTTRPSIHATCIGGGAGAELVAFAALLNFLAPDLHSIQLNLLDVADWATPLDQLQTALAQPPQLSAYASAAAKAANIALVPDASALRVSFRRVDVLDDDDGVQLLLGESTLVTLFFTLNELYASSVPRTQAMLLRVTEACQAGATLVVVDSPGSYSAVSLASARDKGEEDRQYPMHWLLELVLLRPAVGREMAPWTKVEELSSLSRWFRFDVAGSSAKGNTAGLKYALPLEDMRCQVHVYRRNDDDDDGDTKESVTLTEA